MIARHSAPDATNFNAGLRYGNTQVRAIYDRFHIEHPWYLTTTRTCSCR
jgi:hypothetical protein